MKLVKLSLIAMMAMGTMSVASDSLSEALTSGDFDGKLKAYYFDRDKGNGTTKGSILNLGVDLNYVTGSFYGFKAGLGTQTSAAPFVDADGKSAFSRDMYGSGTVLSQAYLDYTVSKTTFKVGRQYIKDAAMPILASSGSRLIRQAFQGAIISNKDIANTSLYAAYVNKFQNRVDGAGDIADFENLTGDYAYSIGVMNKSIPNTTLRLAYGEADESHDMYYLDAKYKNKTDSFSYSLAAQYGATDYESASTDDANYYGLKAGIGMEGFNAYVAYAEVQDGTAAYAVTGHGSKPTIFTTAIIDAGEYAESEQYAIDVNYTFKDSDFKIGARYVDVDYATDYSADWKILYSSYKFKGSLKGLTTSVLYEEKDHDVNTNDSEELWLKLSYKF